MCSPVQTSVPVCIFPKEVDVGRSSSHRGSGPTCHPLLPFLMGSRSQFSRGWAEGDSGTGKTFFLLYQGYDPRWHFMPGIHLAVLMSSTGEACQESWHTGFQIHQ